MKHIDNHNYLYCARCGYDWNVTDRQAAEAGPYICPLCRKIYRVQERRTKRDDEQKQN